jgi:hypothetical protein
MTDTPPRDLIARLEEQIDRWPVRLRFCHGFIAPSPLLHQPLGPKCVCCGESEQAHKDIQTLLEAAALLRAEAEPNLTAQLLASQGQVAALRAALKDTLDYWEQTGFADCEPDCNCIVDQVRAALASLDPEPAGRSQE